MTPGCVQVIALSEHQWPELYRLMMAQKFPAVPARYTAAEPFFRAAKLFGVTDETDEVLQLGLVFGEPVDGVAFLDVVCAPSEHGRWATPGRLRALYQLAFAPAPQGLGLRGVWVQPHGPRALKACLQAGFVPGSVPGIGLNELEPGSAPVLLMTPFSVPQRYRADGCQARN